LLHDPTVVWMAVMIDSFIACIATAIYFEARGEPFLGQIAVGHVIMNRVESENYPNDPCSVVTQSQTYEWNPDVPIRNKCQFSFYCDGKSDMPKDKEAYELARMIAWGVYNERVSDPTDGSVYYHAEYVAPLWASKKQYYRKIETHIFYKDN